MSRLVEGDTPRELFADAQGGVTVGGREGGIVAEGAAPGGQAAVAVGAAKAGIYGDFAHAAAENALQVFRVLAIALHPGRQAISCRRTC